jgi:hypothetical protein
MDIIFSLCIAPLVVTIIGGVVLMIIEYKSGVFSAQVRQGELGQASEQIAYVTQNILKQIVKLSRAIVPPLVDFRDQVFIKLVKFGHLVLGNTSRDLAQTTVQVRNVRQPIVKKYGKRYIVLVEFTLWNAGREGLVDYWVEFPAGEMLQSGQMAKKIFTSNRVTVEAPAIDIKKIRKEYSFPDRYIPLAFSPYTIDVHIAVKR